MKLSVVIPVYRTEATLDRCVESVLAQNVDDMEVILVDDGSPDNCPQICDKWAAQESRISVIHQVNGGLSSARNAGIEEAVGDLITFVDSDDAVMPNTYGPFIAMISDHDILEYSIADKLSLSDRIYYDMNEYWLQSQAYTHTYAWNKIYRRTLFNNVRYPVGNIFEDVYTLPILLRKAKSIITTSKGYYQYITNPEGITSKADGQGLSQLLDAHLTSGMPVDDNYYMYLVNIQIDVWERTHAHLLLTPRQVKTDTLPPMKKYKAIINNIFGLKALCNISRVIHIFKLPNRS